MDVEGLIAAVKAALLPRAEVRAALIFGSQVTGRARQDSDIDIAVLLDAPPLPSERKEQLRTLLEALGSSLRMDRVDLVLLNEAPSKLAFQVLKHGRVVFARDPIELHRFRVRTYSRHADYQPIERLFREATKRRVLTRGGHASRGGHG